MTNNTQTTLDNVVAPNIDAASYQANTVQVPNQVAAAVATVFHGNRLEQIAHSAAHWHNTVYATSNDMLYAILGDCYAYFEDIRRDDATGKQLKADLITHCEKTLGKFNKDDHTLTSIVKCVFGYNAKNRKRISSYSIALRAAVEAKQKSANIAQFIKDAGGVEELRLGQAKTGMTVEDKVNAAKAAITSQNLAQIDSEAVAEKLDAAATGKLVALVAEQLPNGQLAIKAIVDKQAVVDAVLASYYAINKDAIKAEQKNKQTSEATETLDKAVQEALDQSQLDMAA